MNRYSIVVSQMPGIDKVGDIWPRAYILQGCRVSKSQEAHRMAQKQAAFGGAKPANVLVLKKANQKGWRVSAIYESYIWAE